MLSLTICQGVRGQLVCLNQHLRDDISMLLEFCFCPNFSCFSAGLDSTISWEKTARPLSPYTLNSPQYELVYFGSLILGARQAACSRHITWDSVIQYTPGTGVFKRNLLWIKQLKFIFTFTSAALTDAVKGNVRLVLKRSRFRGRNRVPGRRMSGFMESF